MLGPADGEYAPGMVPLLAAGEPAPTPVPIGAG